jgi:hypothetical protein
VTEFARPEEEMVTAMVAHDIDLRQELLGRIRAHQASINTYARKMRARRKLVVNISIVSSAIAAALMVGPSLGSDTFTVAVAKGLGWADDSSVWGLLCKTALIVNVVAAISANLSKSNDPTERIATTEACNAALEELGTDVEFGKHSVKIAAAEYGKIAAKILFVAADSVDDADTYSNNGATAPPPSRVIDWYRRSAEVVMPGMAIVFGCIILAIMVIGLVLSHGVAEAGSQVNTVPRLELSTTQVKKGDNYSVTASGFEPGEDVQFLWTGPTCGKMAPSPPVDLGGRTTLGGIVENDPPGDYTIVAIGLKSKLTAFLPGLVVQPGN